MRSLVFPLFTTNLPSDFNLFSSRCLRKRKLALPGRKQLGAAWYLQGSLDSHGQVPGGLGQASRSAAHGSSSSGPADSSPILQTPRRLLHRRSTEPTNVPMKVCELTLQLELEEDNAYSQD